MAATKRNTAEPWHMDVLIGIHQALVGGNGDGKKRTRNVRNLREKVEGQSSETDTVRRASSSRRLLRDKEGASV